ncbi:MAG: ABC transporter permease [Planctomycetota bacterium]
MKKIVGLVVLIVGIAVVTALASRDPAGGYPFLSGFNVANLLSRIGRFGVLSVAAAFVIVTGGIDLSIGSVVCVAGCLLPWLVHDLGVPGFVALPLVLLVAAAIGLFHGVCVVWVRLQPFVVTLCGLLLYRGLMRAFTGDQTMRLAADDTNLIELAEARVPLGGGYGLPVPLLVLLGVAAVTSLVWRRSVAGRHLFALGHNEEAARLAGVPTKRLTVLAYVACSLLAGLGGCLFVLEVKSAQAQSFGSFYELYAIAGAVLGGTALRGGEGTVLGVVLGASLMQLLSNTINLVGRSNQLEFAVVGAVILAGAALDEGVRRYVRRR